MKTNMVGTDGIEFLNFVAECERLVDDELDKLVRGGFPREQLKLLVDGSTPQCNDTNSNLA